MLHAIIADIKRFFPESSEPISAVTLRAGLRGVLSPGFGALLTYRVFRAAHVRGIPTQPLRFLAERTIELTTGISLPVAADIGPGLRIHHFGGIFLHPGVKLGAGCTLFQDVTVGTNGLTEAAPVVGDRVLIGAGAKVLGGITVGEDCRIGANAVVVHSFPPGAVLVGIPARNCKAPRQEP